MNSPLYRPPAEAHSLILQLDKGCPHNTCTFCGMYKQVRFERRTMDQCRELIANEARLNPTARRIFLADGDVMSRPFPELKEILSLIDSSFQRITRVSVYSNGQSIVSKTEAELEELHQLRLHTLYMGLESGSNAILKQCRKDETAEEMTAACGKAQSAGLRISVMILLGLGGVTLSEEHSRMTAEALNRMQPRLLSALRVVPVPGTPLYNETIEGKFAQLSEWDAVDELCRIIAGLELESTVFRANHSSNVIPLEGRFPRDKDRLLAELGSLLESDALDRTSPGPMPMWL